MQKLRESISVLRDKNVGGKWPPFHQNLLSLTSGDRKNKNTKLEDRILTLNNAKVGETLLLVSH